MADDSVFPFEIEFLGSDEAAAALARLGETGAEAFAKILDAASKGDFTGLATLIGGPVAGSFTKAAESALEFVKSQAEAAEQLSELADVAGTSMTAMQGMEEAFAAGGVGAQGFERSMLHLTEVISQSWAGIQENSRTIGTQEQSAQLGIAEAALNTEKAYNNLQKTMQGVSDQAVNDADKIASSQTNLKKALLTQEKDNTPNGAGDASTKASEEALKTEEDRNAVIRARNELEQANEKAAQDEADAVLKIKEAEQQVEKARLAEAEAAEKAYETDLKNIPKIADEIKSVVAGTSQWKDHMDLADVSAQNLANGIIKAASAGGERPAAAAVMKELAELFSQTGDKAVDMGTKVEIVQRLMGAGFRQGQASVSQLIAVLNQGPEAMERFRTEMEDLQKSGIGVTDKDVETLKDFSGAWAELTIVLQSVTEHFAAVMAPGFTAFFNQVKASVESSDGTLHQIIETIQTFVKEAVADLPGVLRPIMAILSGIEELASAFDKFTGLKPSTLFLGLELAAGSFATILGACVKGVGLLVEGLGLLARNKAMEDLGAAASKTADEIAAAGRAAVADSLTKAANGNQTQQGQGQTATAGSQAEQSAAQATGQAAQTQQAAAEQLSTAGTKQTDAADKQDAAAQSLTQAATALQTAADTLSKGSPSSPSSTPEGKAGGGLIRGPGGPRDDRAGLFALSNDEFVMQAAAVQHYGVDLFNALNDLAIGGFAGGGLVGSAVRVASPTGGASKPSSILNLTIDGQHFNGLRAPDDVAGRLKNYSISRQSASTGRKPSWMR